MRFDNFLLFIFLIHFSCEKTSNPKASMVKEVFHFKYSKNIKVYENNGVIEVFYPKIGKKTKIPSQQLPITSCFAMNTSTCAFLEALQAEALLKGVASPEYIYSNKIQQKIQQNLLNIVGNDSQWFFEKIMISGVKFIFCNYNPTMEKTYAQLESNGVYILFVDEFTESEPLARAEYIRFLGRLLGKQPLANRIFSEIEKDYINEKKSVQHDNSPSVFAKIMYGDVWYMPAGQSYSAILYKDAGAHYLWQDELGSGSISLSFETVFKKASQADLWLDVSDVSSPEELLSFNQEYRFFKAFQSQQMYSLNGKLKGKANDFYESGVVYPNRILRELKYILHNYSHINPDSLYYYKKL